MPETPMPKNGASAEEEQRRKKRLGLSCLIVLLLIILLILISFFYFDDLFGGSSPEAEQAREAAEQIDETINDLEAERDALTTEFTIEDGGNYLPCEQELDPVHLTASESSVNGSYKFVDNDSLPWLTFEPNEGALPGTVGEMVDVTPKYTCTNVNPVPGQLTGESTIQIFNENGDYLRDVRFGVNYQLR